MAEPEDHPLRLLRGMRSEILEMRSGIREFREDIRGSLEDVNARLDGVTHILTLLAATLGSHRDKPERLERDDP